MLEGIFKDHSSELEETLNNFADLELKCQVVLQQTCEDLGISSDDYQVRLSVTKGFISKEEQRRKIQQNIEAYIAKGNTITTPVSIQKERSDIGKQLDEIQRKYEESKHDNSTNSK